MKKATLAKVATVVASMAIVALIALVAFAVTSGRPLVVRTPEPSPTVATQPRSLFDFEDKRADVTPPPTEAPPAAVEAPAPPADDSVVDEGTVDLAPDPEPVPDPEPAPVPVLCPGGSTATASDGFNDTSCLPDTCFSIMLPDPAHPECDAPFRP